MNVLFYSRSCPHCEGLFRTGMVSPTAVRLVCVDTTGVALPPEVHSVPSLWVSALRKLLVGPDVKKYFTDAKSRESAAAHAHDAVPSDPAGCSLGDGGCGAFSSIDDANVGNFGDSAAFLSLTTAYGNDAAGTAGAAAGGQLPAGVETRGSFRNSQGVSVDEDAFKTRRDEELSDILMRQRPPNM